MKSVVQILIGALALVACAARGNDDRANAPGPEPGAGRAAGSDAERAIRASVEEYTRAYNAGDARALAALYTKDAEVVDEDGVRYTGRDAIERMAADLLKASPGARLAVTVDSLRFLGRDVAKEEGRSTVHPSGGGAPLTNRYTALYVKRDGRWLLDSEREEPEPKVRPHDRLKEIEWMVGEWVDEAPDSVVKTDCRWSKDGNFLLRHLTMRVRGAAVMTVSQRIGWDPLSRQIKSWVFDSEGGHGEGLWTQDGRRWVIKQTGVLPDGRTASGTHIIVQESPNRARWLSTDRVVGGQAVVQDAAYVMVRVPPAPGSRAGEKAAPSPKPARDEP
jgi:uncharacterized protein (TIGR02246 family)